MTILHRPDDLNHTETVYFDLFTHSVSELEHVFKHKFSNVRNYVTRFERERLNGSRLHGENEHARNGTRYYRYSIANRKQCETLIKAYNLSRTRRKLNGLNVAEQASLLAKFDDE